MEDAAGSEETCEGEESTDGKKEEDEREAVKDKETGREIYDDEGWLKGRVKRMNENDWMRERMGGCH